MAEKSKMDKAFEKRDIFMIMDSEDMDKYLFSKYRYYPATDDEFDNIGYFKFVMYDDTTTADDLLSAYDESVKFGRGFGINIGIVINIEIDIYEKNKKLIDAFVSDHNMEHPYFIERRGKPQEKWNHRISLSGNEVRDMVNECGDNERKEFLIEGLYHTSMRIGEFIAMRAHWVEMEDGIMIINVPREEGTFRTKTAAGERSIYITDKRAISVINEWFADHESFGKSDVTAWTWCKDLAEKAGISTRVTPHILRHSGISKWSQDGGLLPDTVQKMAGHNDINFTMNYYIHQIKGEIPLDVKRNKKE